MKEREVLISLSLVGILLSLVLKIKLYIISGILLFIYLAFPGIGDFIGVNFLKITRALGKLFSYVFLMIVFYIILLPLSLFYKLTHRNPLFLESKGVYSTFVDRRVEYNKEHLENMW